MNNMSSYVTVIIDMIIIWIIIIIVLLLLLCTLKLKRSKNSWVDWLKYKCVNYYYENKTLGIQNMNMPVHIIYVCELSWWVRMGYFAPHMNYITCVGDAQRVALPFTLPLSKARIPTHTSTNICYNSMQKWCYKGI